VSVTPVRVFVFAYVSVLSYAVASRGTHTYSFLFYCSRSLAVTAAPVRFMCTIATVTLPGSFILRSTRGRVQLPVSPLFSVSSRLLAAKSTASNFARAWSSAFKARGIGTRHRYPRTCNTTSVLLSPANFQSLPVLGARYSQGHPFLEHHYLYGVV
jgi:hypothetical protein